MAKTIPTAYQQQNLRELAARSPVLASSWSSSGSDYGLVEALHFLWSRSGARMGGHIFGDTPWATTQTSYQTANDNAGLNLDELLPSGTCERLLSGDNVEFEIGAIAEDCDLQAVIWNANTSTSIATLTASTSGGSTELISDTASVAVADAQDGSSDPALLYALLSAKARSTEAKIYGFAVYESVVASTSDLPTG